MSVSENVRDHWKNDSAKENMWVPGQPPSQPPHLMWVDQPVPTRHVTGSPQASILIPNPLEEGREGGQGHKVDPSEKPPEIEMWRSLISSLHSRGVLGTGGSQSRDSGGGGGGGGDR